MARILDYYDGPASRAANSRNNTSLIFIIKLYRSVNLVVNVCLTKSFQRSKRGSNTVARILDIYGGPAPCAANSPGLSLLSPFIDQSTLSISGLTKSLPELPVPCTITPGRDLS